MIDTTQHGSGKAGFEAPKILRERYGSIF